MNTALLSNLFIGLIIGLGFVSCSKDYQGDEHALVHIKKKDGHFMLYKNGAPFYIQGASGNAYFKELHEIGGNTIRVYDTIGLQKVLDQAANNQLAVIVDLPLPRFTPEGTFFSDKKKTQQLHNEFKKLIAKHGSHPALLAWNLGNEVNYPIRPKYSYFYKVFNDLITMIHQQDPNHPVTTTLSRKMLRRRILSLRWHSPDLDFLSINVFGKLNDLESDIAAMSWIWNGPYLLSEWGINGPWETNYTAWQAPVEATSTKKAEHLKERYHNNLSVKKPNALGNLVFYWGQKQEGTHTWFSLFDKKGRKTQMIQELQQLWTQKPIAKLAPQIDYMLINQKGALDNCLFEPKTLQTAELKFHSNTKDSLTIQWELFPENWGYNLGENQYAPPMIPKVIKEQQHERIVFETPNKEGAYRLFAYVYDNHGHVASANTPFYVLKSADD